MDKLAKQQACQLFIEQEIEKGLADGKTTYSIGKEVAQWIQKLFEAKVRPETITERARRTKERLSTGVDTSPITYFVSNSQQVKIGKSEEYKLKERLSLLQCGNPKKLNLILSIKGDKEKHFQNHLAEYRKRGEWFNLPKDYVENVKSFCKENNLDFLEYPQNEMEYGGTREGAGRPLKFRVIPDQSHFRTSFTGENESYTPIIYIEAARKVLKKIDLDPATSEFGQKRVKAEKYYTAKDDAIIKDWKGKIWMNPPYSQPLIYDFIKKAVNEYKGKNIIEAIILTNNYTDTQWFHLAESVSSLLCFTKGRIKFEKEDGSIAQAMNGQIFFYWGENGKIFTEVFLEFGFIR